MIEFIDNQTIKFTQEGEADTCGCVGTAYCQPVRFTDETQFQIKGDIVNSDPTFGDSYVGWETWPAIFIDIGVTGITEEGLCNGSITVTPSGGSGIYEVSIDGVNFYPLISSTFVDLCEGTYLITVRDSGGHYASIHVFIGIATNCSALAGSDANDVISIETNNILNCYANDLI